MNFNTIHSNTIRSTFDKLYKNPSFTREGKRYHELLVGNYRFAIDSSPRLDASDKAVFRIFIGKRKTPIFTGIWSQGRYIGNTGNHYSHNHIDNKNVDTIKEAFAAFQKQK